MYIFSIVYGISFVIALTFPIAVKCWLPASTEPNRWIQNCVPFSVFMTSAFPIAMGIFAVTIFSLKDVNGIDVFAVKTFGAPSLLFASIAALLFLVVLTSVIVLHDFTSRPVGPYILRRHIAAEAFQLEKELRDAAKTESRDAAKTVRVRRRRRAGTRRGAGQAKSNSRSSEITTKIQRYQSLVRLNSLREIRKRGNLVAAAYLGIAWMGCMCVIFYFWYVAVLVLSNQKLPDGAISKLLMVFILLITWLPMRLHMDWYQNYFHNPEWLTKSNGGFFLGIIVTTAGIALLIFFTKPEGIVIACGIANLLGLLSVVFVGVFKPEWLRTFAEAFQSMPFVYFFAAYVLVLFVTVTVGIRILNT
jgi:hypothetical protein